jgi:site-specific DNA-methyltransferase (adenine-specific)
VCYFLWEKDHQGKCSFTSVNTGVKSTAIRDLKEFPIFVRYNEAVNIIHKIKAYKEDAIEGIMKSRNPFGIPTSARGSKKRNANSYVLISSEGVGFVPQSEILSNNKIATKYKVMVTRIMREHAGEPDKNGQFSVLATVKVLRPKEVCTDSYIVGGGYGSAIKAKNLAAYLQTKFTRFLILQAAASINLSRATYQFVPMQDFSKPWTDAELYKKYKLTKEEIDFIESMIKPME